MIWLFIYANILDPNLIRCFHLWSFSITPAHDLDQAEPSCRLCSLGKRDELGSANELHRAKAISTRLTRYPHLTVMVPIGRRGEKKNGTVQADAATIILCFIVHVARNIILMLQ